LDEKKQPEYSLAIKLQRRKKPARFHTAQNLWSGSHICSAVPLLIRMMALCIKRMTCTKPEGL